MKTTLVALNAQFMHTNLAIRQLLPTLSGFDVRFYEGYINLPYRKILQDVAQGEPDVIGFSCYIWNIHLVLRLCRALRLALPRAVIVLGGPEVAARGEDVPEADYVLGGEGELSLAPLLGALKRGERPEAPQMPGPLPVSRWTDPYAGGVAGLENRILYTETSRGCPFGCKFCLSAGESVRALPAEEAVRRLTALADGGAKLIKLVDRTFNFDKRRANQIWAALISHADRTGYRGTYHFEIGAQLIDGAALAVLERAPEGLFQFEVGIQSTDSGVLKAVGRTAAFGEIADAVRRIRALRNIHLHVDLIAGLPGEDMAKFERSFDEVYALGAEQLQLGFLKLLHGSALRAEAGALGIVFDPDAPYEVLRTREMSFFELCFLKDVEQALDWYGARYPASLRWLLLTRRPFALFSELARNLRQSGVLAQERGEKARAQALLSAFDSPALRQLIRHDLLTLGRRRDLPDALCFQETDEQRALLRQRFHPVRGQCAFEYDFDVQAFAETGVVQMKAALVIYS